MNTLELKGSLIEMVNNTQSDETLKTLLRLFKKTVSEETADWWDDLTLEEQLEFETSLAECDDPTKLTSHEQVMKMSEQWLNE